MVPYLIVTIKYHNTGRFWHFDRQVILRHILFAGQTNENQIRAIHCGGSINRSQKNNNLTLFYTISNGFYTVLIPYPKMKRIILLVVLVLHSILLYTDYAGSGVTAVNASSKTKETNFFSSSSRYFQFEKGKLSSNRIACDSRCDDLFSIIQFSLFRFYSVHRKRHF